MRRKEKRGIWPRWRELQELGKRGCSVVLDGFDVDVNVGFPL